MLYDPFGLLSRFVLQLEELLGKVLMSLLYLYLGSLGLFLLLYGDLFLSLYIFSLDYFDIALIKLFICLIILEIHQKIGFNLIFAILLPIRPLIIRCLQFQNIKAPSRRRRQVILLRSRGRWLRIVN